MFERYNSYKINIPKTLHWPFKKCHLYLSLQADRKKKGLSVYIQLFCAHSCTPKFQQSYSYLIQIVFTLLWCQFIRQGI